MGSWAKRIRKHWITMWLVTAVLFLAILTVSASYIGNKEVKRVVSTRSVTDAVFSSNVMVAPDGTKSLYSDNTTKHYTYPVTVCNFAQMTPAIHAMEEINYKLTATLMKYSKSGVPEIVKSVPVGDSGNLTFSIQKIVDNNSTLTADPIYSLSDKFTYTYENESLDRTISCTDTFLLTFDRSLMEKENAQYCIYIKAIPLNTNAVSGTVTEIGCYVDVSKGMIYDTGWSGELAETDDKDYDAYNLIVSGSGAGTIEVTFDSSRFSISEVFLNDSENTFLDMSNNKVTGENALIDDADANWKKLILEVNSIDQNRYEIQFFKKDSAVYNSASEVNNYIKCRNYKPKTAASNGQEG